MAVTTYTKTGNKATTQAKLDKSVFDVEVKSHDLLKQVYVAYLANGRGSDAVVKTRGLVRGGGKKPWKQKGTGRARFGSSRNPIWRGGGIVFGPTGEENYSHKVTTNSKRAALRQALTLASKDKVKIIENFDFKDGRVKPVVALLDKIDAKGRILLVVDNKDDLARRATSNIPNVDLVQANFLNVYDVMNADTIVISVKALEMVNQWLGVKAPVKTTASSGGEK